MQLTDVAGLEAKLRSDIPLARMMGIEVCEFNDSFLEIRAPFEKNSNHKCTAFGGSLFSTAVLCGWGLIYLTMRQNDVDGHIVIMDSNIVYHRPVIGDLVARCKRPAPQTIDRVVRLYHKRGKARLELDVVIEHEGQVACTFQGRYVVHQ